MKLEFVSKTELVPGVWELRWQPLEPLVFTPGQYADFEVMVGGSGHDFQPESRTFTLVSHPSEGEVRFIMRFERPGSLYKRALMALEPGNTGAMTEPIGFAVLPADLNKPLVFVAQGIGIASALSPLAEIGRQAGQASRRDVSVWWARRPEEGALLDDFAYKGLVGSRHDVIRPERLTADEVAKSSPEGAIFYVSGTQYFVSSMGDGLHEAGVAPADVIFDYYEGYVEL